MLADESEYRLLGVGRASAVADVDERVACGENLLKRAGELCLALQVRRRTRSCLAANLRRIRGDIIRVYSMSALNIEWNLNEYRTRATGEASTMEDMRGLRKPSTARRVKRLTQGDMRACEGIYRYPANTVTEGVDIGSFDLADQHDHGVESA